MKRNSFILILEETDESHGPAKTILPRPGVFAVDRVNGLRCKEWPRPADAFLSRKRKCNWLLKRLIEQMQSLGFFVVNVGHPASPERDIEWRISLSLQGRLLMQSLFIAQFQCLCAVETN